MAWLKKNLVLVVASAVALGLLGFAGFFLFTKIQKESAVTTALEEQTKEFDTLVNLKPHPGNEKVNNIEEAKKQEKELMEYVEQAHKTFAPAVYPTNLDSGGFKLYLDNTIDELQRTAERAGVKLPQNYYFTFAAQKSQMSFDRASIQPLAAMVAEVKAITQIILDARVLSLEGAKRIAVVSQDSMLSGGSQSDFWSRKGTTNDLAITIPYEFTFHCFSAELGAVLEGLYRAPQCFIVKRMIIDPTLSPLLDKNAADAAAQGGDAASPQPAMSAQMMMMRRYGIRPNMMQAQPLVDPAQAAAANAPTLDEKPFRVVMWVEAVRLRDPKEAKAAAKAARPARAPAGDAANPGAAGDGSTPADATQPAAGAGDAPSN